MAGRHSIARFPDRRRLHLHQLARLLLALALLLPYFSLGRAAEAANPNLMCDYQVQPRTQTVSIDPDLTAAGVSRDDVLAAFQPWNDLFQEYYGFPIFTEYTGDWQDADILITAHGGWSTTWVDTPCSAGFVQRGANQAIVFLGAQDAWRNQDLLPHEMGHTLGFADHGPAAEQASGHVNYLPCDTSYLGVMSYCAGPQTWFLDIQIPGITLDGQLVATYWQ